MKTRIFILSLIAVFATATVAVGQTPKADKPKTEAKCDKKAEDKACCKEKKADEKACCKDKKAEGKACCKDKKAEGKECSKADGQKKEYCKEKKAEAAKK